MSENKTGKYIKYALGEISLVMIGILLALQINNWNQDRQTDIQINNYLKSMLIDLKSDIDLYEENIEYSKTYLENISWVLTNDDYKQLEADSIIALINRNWGNSLLSTQTFEKIKSVGLENILGNPEIDKAVNDYYNKSAVHFDYYIEWNRESTNRDDLFWYYNDHFEAPVGYQLNLTSVPYRQDSATRKKELIKLIESTLGRNYLKNALNRDEFGIEVSKLHKSTAEELVALIEKEIGK